MNTKNITDEQLLNMAGIVSRQTNYTIEQAKENLLSNNYNIVDVIREYNGSSKVTNQQEKPVKSVNQQTFIEIRKLMDNASSNYRTYKELKEDKEQLKNKLGTIKE